MSVLLLAWGVARGFGTEYILPTAPSAEPRNIARPGYTRRYVLDDFHYEGGGLRCEDVPLSEIAAGAGTPTYVYSHAALERAYTELDEAFSGPGPPGLLRGQGQRQPRRVAGARLLRGRGGHRLRRGALQGHAGRVRPQEGRLRRGREDRARAHVRPRGAHPALQRRVRFGAGSPRPHLRPLRQAGPRGAARQPRRRRRDPRPRHDGEGPRQVRHPRGRGARARREDRELPVRRPHRRPPAHRVPDHQARPLHRVGRTLRRPRRRAQDPRLRHQVLQHRRRPRHPLQGRRDPDPERAGGCHPAHARGDGDEDPVRDGPLHRGRRRSPPDPASSTARRAARRASSSPTPV